MGALHLEAAIGTASVLERDGDLPELFEWMGYTTPAVFPEGINTPLDWHSPDEDAETRAIRASAQDAFTSAIETAGYPVPQTVGDLAKLLAKLGVYEHSVVRGVHRWRGDADVPEPGMVLRLPEQWLDQEDRARWIIRTGDAAAVLYDSLVKKGRPRALSTSISQLAGDFEAEADLIRDGIEGLCSAGGMALERNDKTITSHDLQRLADHARFKLLLDWSVLDDRWATKHDPEWPPGEVRWEGSPWACVRGVLRDPRTSREAAQVMASFGFTLRQPTGESSIATVAEFAAAQGSSLSDCVDAMLELERTGLLEWDSNRQEARVVTPNPQR